MDADTVTYDVDSVDFRTVKGDSFLLCSDGFWEWIEEKNMSSILKQDVTAYDALMEMISVVKAKGEGNGMDNYSAILVNIK